MVSKLEQKAVDAQRTPIWMANKVVLTPITTLRPYAKNNRRHKAANIERLKACIAQFGFVTPILIDGSGVIIAGHGRLKHSAFNLRHIQRH